MMDSMLHFWRYHVNIETYDFLCCDVSNFVLYLCNQRSWLIEQLRLFFVSPLVDMGFPLWGRTLLSQQPKLIKWGGCAK